MPTSYPKQLEQEAIYIIRETLANFRQPVLLFSGGKDSTVLLHLLCKAYFPLKPQIPLLHIDTGHNFPEVLAFRDKIAAHYGLKIWVGDVAQTLQKQGILEAEYASRNAQQSLCLLECIEKYNIDALLGGARRDEEAARAKERIFSLRDQDGAWQPHNQRPEVFELYNTHLQIGQNMRIFPLSDWTEMDIWNYIKAENIPLPNLYFAHKRKVFEREGMLFPLSRFLKPPQESEIFEEKIRFRTVGDETCSTVFRSDADSIQAILTELATTRISERGGRADDKVADSAMEKRKKEGYF